MKIFILIWIICIILVFLLLTRHEDIMCLDLQRRLPDETEESARKHIRLAIFVMSLLGPITLIFRILVRLKV